MEFIKVVKNRRSNRFLSSEKLNKNDIEYMLEVAEQAPVALGNYHNIKLLVIQGETLKKLQKRFVELNGRDNTFGGSVLIVILHKGTYELIANQDAGIIGEHICLAATELNIGNVYLHSIVDMMNTDSYIKNDLLNIESEFLVMCGVILGKKTSDQTRNVAHKFDRKYFD